MKLTELYPSNLLKAQDVTEAGGEMEFTIFNVELKEFDGDNGAKERKPILIFVEDNKRMVLNKTNGNAIGEMFGDETDAWINKKITLVVQEVDFAGKRTPAIRIKNLNSKETQIQTYWTKTRELGMSRDEGLAHLKQFSGDFGKALDGLESPF